jgi:hypothetical protein
LDKGEFKIVVACIASDPANRGAVLMAADADRIDARHIVVFAPGTVEPALVDDMLKQNISVVPYVQIAQLENVLRLNAVHLAKYRAIEKDMLTRRLDPPIPARIRSAASCFNLGASSKVTLVAETSRVQCFFRGTGTERLLISFNDSWRAGVEGRLHPDMELDELGYSVVDFVSVEPNWFPADDMAALVPFLNQHLGDHFPERITFGFSQGGYGAIKYSQVLKASRTIAFSPQFSIDPRIVESDRFSRYFSTNLHVGMSIERGDCTCPGYIFYDPYEADDQAQFSLISSKVVLTNIEVPFVGHGTRLLFATPERLIQVLRASLRGDLVFLRKLVAATRRGGHDRSYLIAMQLARTRPLLALRLAARHRDTWPQEHQHHLCYRLAENGQVSTALLWVTELAQSHRDNAEIQGCAALIASKAGDTALAYRFVDRALFLDPDSKQWKKVREEIWQV